MLLELTKYEFKNFVFRSTENYQLIKKKKPTWENICNIYHRKSVDVLNI